jgi:glucose-1-phosphate thymidylyltransferase
MRCFILAGGFATRLWPLTERRAKPLLPLAGKPILTHLVEGIPEGIPITVSTNAAFAEAFCGWAASAPRRNIEVIVEHAGHEREKLGALGALAQWIREAHITDDVLVLTGDNMLGFRMSDFIGAYRAGTALIAAHDIGDLAKASAFGTVVLAQDDRTVVAFEEKPEQPRSTLVSAGCFILPAASLALVQQHAQRHPDNIGSAIEALVAAGQPVDCFRFTEAWFDIGSFEAYVEATQTMVGDAVLLDRDAAVEECVTEGSIVLGRGSIVRKSRLKDVVVFGQCVIDDCILEQCVIDDGCVLKGIDLTGKMLRSGTRLERSTIGLSPAV